MLTLTQLLPEFPTAPTCAHGQVPVQLPSFGPFPSGCFRQVRVHPMWLVVNGNTTARIFAPRHARKHFHTRGKSLQGKATLSHRGSWNCVWGMIATADKWQPSKPVFIAAGSRVSLAHPNTCSAKHTGVWGKSHQTCLHRPQILPLEALNTPHSWFVFMS